MVLQDEEHLLGWSRVITVASAGRLSAAWPAAPLSPADSPARSSAGVTETRAPALSAYRVSASMVSFLAPCTQ